MTTTAISKKTEQTNKGAVSQPILQAHLYFSNAMADTKNAKEPAISNANNTTRQCKT
jgi:hypothetical protein